MNMKILIPAVILVVGVLVLGFFKSNLTRDHASATFSPHERGMNTLTVKAPYGYYVLEYSVVPRGHGDERFPYKIGGHGGGSPVGLFDEDKTHSTKFPASGAIDFIPLEEQVRISSKLDVVATVCLPENKKILEKCGTYIVVTRDKSLRQRIPEIVEKMEFVDAK